MIYLNQFGVVDQSAQTMPAGAASKQKLPHGLTVSELKEMTKARLQAEAAEQMHGRKGNKDGRGMSPLAFCDSQEHFVGRDPTRSAGASGSDSMNSIPSIAHQVSRDIGVQKTQSSPLPPGFQSIGLYPSGRGESWENASVTSHNSNNPSDSLGADSTYQLGIGGSLLSAGDGDAMYGRGRSFSAHQSRSREEGSLTAISPNPGGLFDVAVGTGNRRRAVTLSPRAVPIHEERSGFDVGSLAMPNMTRGNGTKLISRPARNAYSPVLDIALEHDVFGSNTNEAHLNRPRTSSATSLQPARHGLDEFNRSRAHTFDGFSASDPNGNQVANGIPRALMPSFLQGQDTFGSQRTDASLSDSVPPGFSNDRRVDSLSPYASFGTGEAHRSVVHGLGADEMGALTDSMGSILKLSGVGLDRPDRERSNTYPYASFEK